MLIRLDNIKKAVLIKTGAKLSNLRNNIDTKRKDIKTNNPLAIPLNKLLPGRNNLNTIPQP